MDSKQQKTGTLRNVTDEAFTQALSKLNLAGVDNLAETLLAEAITEFRTPVLLKDSADTVVTLWLHGRQKRTCWWFKALYEYEAFVATGPDPGSPRFRVDSISLHIRRAVDGANYTHSCGSTDYCAKSDEIFATFGACGQSCFNASATYAGTTWGTNSTCLD
jgi:hypothetical protein